MKEFEKKKISKFLSRVLRHAPETVRLKLDEQGWADVNDLISRCAAKGVKFSFKELQEVVDTNDKKRFAFNEDKTRIRASQGHSIKIELGLQAITPPHTLYHGTAESVYPTILREGIKKMSRQHVHLSSDLSTARKVGSRHGKPVVLSVDTAQMHKDGISFYLSENGVWLTDYVDSRYIVAIFNN